MKLCDLHRGARLVVDVQGRGRTPATFYRVDGMYSLCVLDGDGPERDRVFHLKAWTPIAAVGDHYEVAP